MRGPAWIERLRPPRSGGQLPSNARRDRLALRLALLCVVGLVAALFLSKGTKVLMPGPLTSAHGAIQDCSACHASSGSGKLSWLKGLVAGDRHADGEACLTCHKMPDTAFNAHGATDAVLESSTKRLTEIAARSTPPQSARLQSAAFPTHDVVARGLSCATCHQEHQGAAFDLNKMSNEQCRSCHVVKFDSFAGRHPKFDNYPFKRRTRIVYDHAAHFGKHYPEVAKKDPDKRIPETCATCHTSRDDKRVMAVVPFDKSCSGCHLNQITGKERASGPKGIAFLTLPGLDLPTLKTKNAAVGEWPDASDAALTPFMKVMIGRNKRGQSLLKTVGRLNLQDLTKASDDEIKAVTELAWEIKGLFHALIKGKASDVLGDLNLGSGAKLSASLVADLTANIPRDVVTSAQQEWLPNLGAEMAARPNRSDEKQGSQGSVKPEAKAPERAEEGAPKDARQNTPARSGPPAATGNTDTADVKPDGGKARRTGKDLPPPMRAGVGDKSGKSDNAAGDVDDSEDAVSVDDHGEAVKGRQLLPSGTPRSIRQRAQPDQGEPKSGGASRAKEPDSKDAKPAIQPDGAAGTTDAAKATDGGKESAAAPVPSSPGDQSDDLLFPTEAEQRDMKSSTPSTTPEATAAGKTAPEAGGTAPASTAASPGATPNTTAADTAAAAPQIHGAPVISIASDVDPESWAEYGGWYRQDYAIFYRPTGHKDKFIYSWLFLTGPQAPRDDTSPVAAVFNFLTSKDAQGSCTKCHSVDDINSKGRLVNFTPVSVASKQGQFTSFIHEPHFGVMEDRGCLTCHKLEKAPAPSAPAAEGAANEPTPYLKSYEQGRSQTFVSNFGEVKKDLCKTCHTTGRAGQDCLLCHKYHVNGVTTPILDTKLTAP